MPPIQPSPSFLFVLFLLLFSCAEAQSQGSSSSASTTSTNTTLFVLLAAAFLVSILLAACFCRCADRRNVTTTTTTSNTSSHQKKNLGLDPSLLDSFPTLAYSSVRRLRATHGPLECAVCLSPFADQERLRVLPGCCHVFHPSCIATWLSSHVTCPVCRADLADPAVLANDRCLVGRHDDDLYRHVGPTSGNGEQDTKAVEVLKRSQSVAEDKYTLRLPESMMREIRRAASSAEGREKGRSGRWVEIFRTASGHRRRRTAEVVPVFLEPDADAEMLYLDPVEGLELENSNVRGEP